MNFGRRPGEELYDLKRDPDCVENLAAAPLHDVQKNSMHEELTEKLKAQGDPRMFGRGDIFDRYPIREPVRNFHERYMRGERPPTGWVKTARSTEALE